MFIATVCVIHENSPGSAMILSPASSPISKTGSVSPVIFVFIALPRHADELVRDARRTPLRRCRAAYFQTWWRLKNGADERADEPRHQAAHRVVDRGVGLRHERDERASGADRRADRSAAERTARRRARANAPKSALHAPTSAPATPLTMPSTGSFATRPSSVRDQHHDRIRDDREDQQADGVRGARA